MNKDKKWRLKNKRWKERGVIIEWINKQEKKDGYLARRKKIRREEVINGRWIDISAEWLPVIAKE